MTRPDDPPRYETNRVVTAIRMATRAIIGPSATQGGTSGMYDRMGEVRAQRSGSR